MSFLRIVAGLTCTAFLAVLMTPLLLVLLPWRVGRIRVTNAFGSLIGRSVMWCSGSRVTVEGAEHVRADRPAIYACNHTSILDAFTTIWLTPAGTVGVAKKEVFYYPFYGQAWWLAGHVFLDRQRTDRAKAALRTTAELIRRRGLHICMLPEGTRSEFGQAVAVGGGPVKVRAGGLYARLWEKVSGLKIAEDASDAAIAPSRLGRWLSAEARLARDVFVVGFNPSDPVFNVDDIQRQTATNGLV